MFGSYQYWQTVCIALQCAVILIIGLHAAQVLQNHQKRIFIKSSLSLDDSQGVHNYQLLIQISNYGKRDITLVSAGIRFGESSLLDYNKVFKSPYVLVPEESELTSFSVYELLAYVNRIKGAVDKNNSVYAVFTDRDGIEYTKKITDKTEGWIKEAENNRAYPFTTFTAEHVNWKRYEDKSKTSTENLS